MIRNVIHHRKHPSKIVCKYFIWLCSPYDSGISCQMLRGTSSAVCGSSQGGKTSTSINLLWNTLYGLRCFRKIQCMRLPFNIYTHSNEIHNVVALVKCLLILRCQLYMFRTVTVRPQELLCRYCMCRLWYVVRNALPDTSSWYNAWGSSSSSVVPAGSISTYHSLHIQYLQKKLLRTDRYGPKHVELTPEY